MGALAVVVILAVKEKNEGSKFFLRCNLRGSCHIAPVMQDTLAPSLPLAVVSRRNEKSVMKMESGFASFQRVPAGNMKRAEISTVPLEVRWVALSL